MRTAHPEPVAGAGGPQLTTERSRVECCSSRQGSSSTRGWSRARVAVRPTSQQTSRGREGAPALTRLTYMFLAELPGYDRGTSAPED